MPTTEGRSGSGSKRRQPLLEISAKNLLSFGPDGVSLRLNPLNVLIGPNGSGKSNLLEAISLLQAAPTNLAQPIRDGGGIRDWLWQGRSRLAALEAVVEYPQGLRPLHHTIQFIEHSQAF